MLRLFKLIGVALAAAFVVGQAHAEKPAIFTGLLSNTAVDGFDVVSVFEGNGTKGSSEFTTSYNGAEWRFTSQENLDRFNANPTAFAPQYGGYCAWAVAQGYTAKGDPRYARVVDGKLYLNFNADVQNKWLADVPGFIAKADTNWPGVLSE